MSNSVAAVFAEASLAEASTAAAAAFAAAIAAACTATFAAVIAAASTAAFAAASATASAASSPPPPGEALPSPLPASPPRVAAPSASAPSAIARLAIAPRTASAASPASMRGRFELLSRALAMGRSTCRSRLSRRVTLRHLARSSKSRCAKPPRMRIRSAASSSDAAGAPGTFTRSGISPRHGISPGCHPAELPKPPPPPPPRRATSRWGGGGALSAVLDIWLAPLI
mmetsp:Transcript_50320/g.121043  ORF Transcript_50320/g.121043 Transcript_50320/m.121043 type:complete len:227 (-) Transcript_50320:57-737(-)